MHILMEKKGGSFEIVQLFCYLIGFDPHKISEILHRTQRISCNFLKSHIFFNSDWHRKHGIRFAPLFCYSHEKFVVEVGSKLNYKNSQTRPDQTLFSKEALKILFNLHLQILCKFHFQIKRRRLSILNEICICIIALILPSFHFILAIFP